MKHVFKFSYIALASMVLSVDLVQVSLFIYYAVGENVAPQTSDLFNATSMAAQWGLFALNCMAVKYFFKSARLKTFLRRVARHHLTYLFVFVFFNATREKQMKVKLSKTRESNIVAACGAAVEEEKKEVECACRAKALGFQIDCANKGALLDALKTLQDNDCATGANCKSKSVCDKAFALAQTHHDFCLEDQVPEEVEKAVHTYEDVCDSCEIMRQFNAALPVCAPTECGDTMGFRAAFDYIENAANRCLETNCSNAECAANYRRLRGAHDRCEEDDLPKMIEEAVHDLEDVCAAQECNAADKAFSPECTMTTSGGTQQQAPMPSCDAKHVECGVVFVFVCDFVVLCGVGLIDCVVLQ
jgi:hypothetical protein